jgi:hypothetical protein
VLGHVEGQAARAHQTARSEGKGILTIARTIGVGTSTVQNALKTEGA